VAPARCSLSHPIVLRWRALTTPASGPIKEFGIRNEELRLETVCHDNPSRRSWCPIVIPFGEQLALADLPDEGIPSPEWWLSQVGVLPIRRNPGDERLRGGDAATSPPTTVFSLGQKVRDLAERMRYVEDLFSQTESATPFQVDAHLDLLERIFEVHGPAVVSDSAESLWRAWVRLEVTEAVASAASQLGRRGRRARKLGSTLRQRLLKSQVPTELRLQWRALADARA